MKRFIAQLGASLTVMVLLALAGQGVVSRSASAESSNATPEPTEVYNPTIDPANFGGPIDNPYLPLVPGTTFIYEGTKEDGAQRVEVTVSSETRLILGVPCVVVRDQVTVDGELTEDTFDWYAQDKDGNVWYFGEDSKAYENGKLKGTEGSWEAGVDGALPGIVMPAQPIVGEPYRQEYYAGEAEDMAEVLKLGESVTVPAGSYQDVLVTKEWSPLEPEVVEHKSYAPGVGLVFAVSVQGESEQLALVDMIAPGAATPAAVHWGFN